MISFHTCTNKFMNVSEAKLAENKQNGKGRIDKIGGNINTVAITFHTCQIHQN